MVTPRTDVCQKCEDHGQAIREAVTDQQKAQSVAAFGDHLSYAQAECDLYQNLSKRAKEELQEYAIPSQ